MPTVLVTGASAGFGAEIARRFARDGWSVIGAARRAQEGVSLVLDVRDRAAVEAACADLEVDVLVNNAGLALGMEPAQRASLDEWEQMVDTNCKGLMYVTRAVLPGMVARRRGHVINLGSVAGEWPYPGGNAYGATKAFVRQFSLNLKADLLGTRVRVSEIEPGMAETEFSLVRFGGDAEKARAIYAGTQPLSAEDIADTVHWIVSRPAHVNINTISLMPVSQAFSPFAVKRG